MKKNVCRAVLLILGMTLFSGCIFWDHHDNGHHYGQYKHSGKGNRR